MCLNIVNRRYSLQAFPMGTFKCQYLWLFFSGMVHFFLRSALYFLLEIRTGLRRSISEQQKRRGGWGVGVGGGGERDLFSIVDLLSLFSKMSHSDSDLCLVSPHLELL